MLVVQVARISSPRGTWWRSTNFNRRVLEPAYLAAGWRGPSPEPWTWHSLRHVFCTTAPFTWHIDPADVSRLVGHANIRITLDMDIGTTVGTLDRARTATNLRSASGRSGGRTIEKSSPDLDRLDALV